MKIVSDNDIFIIPLKSKKTLLVTNNYKEKIIDLLKSYFVSKKKSKCIIYDEDGTIINMDDVNFIYLENTISYDNNFNLKQKTILNDELIEIIRNNEREFKTIDDIRNSLFMLKEDKGIKEFEKILSYGLNTNIKISFDNFDLGSLVQMYCIDSEDIDESTMQIVLLNMMLYVNRYKVNVVLLDKNINNETLKWIDMLNDNTYVFIDNENIYGNYDNLDFMILSNKDHLITEENTNDTIKVLSYMNHQFIKDNLTFQNEKNIKILSEYNDSESTFFIKNTYSNFNINL